MKSFHGGWFLPVISVSLALGCGQSTSEGPDAGAQDVRVASESSVVDATRDVTPPIDTARDVTPTLDAPLDVPTFDAAPIDATDAAVTVDAIHVDVIDVVDSATTDTQEAGRDAIVPDVAPWDVVVVDAPAGDGNAVCGDGIVEPGEVCDQPFSADNCGNNCQPITSSDCLQCESDPVYCAEDMSCDIALGVAAAGPAAGTPRSVLCNEVLDCVRQSGCASNDQPPLRCYCGSDTAACINGNPSGPCRNQISAGLETTDFTLIVQRLMNYSYGTGVAMQRITCDQTNCASVCF